MITIEVTQDDIDKGEQGDYTDCPVALAIARAVKKSEPSVGHGHFELQNQGITLSLDMSQKVNRFTQDFNRDKSSVQPFSFDLPDLSEPEWLAVCNSCHGEFDRGELDRDGYCNECRNDEDIEV